MSEIEIFEESAECWGLLQNLLDNNWDSVCYTRQIDDGHIEHLTVSFFGSVDFQNYHISAPKDWTAKWPSI